MYSVKRILRNGLVMKILDTENKQHAEDVFFDETTIFAEYSDSDKLMPNSAKSIELWKGNRIIQSKDSF